MMIINQKTFKLMEKNTEAFKVIEQITDLKLAVSINTYIRVYSRT